MTTTQIKRRKVAVGPEGILRAAEELLATKGFEPVSLRQIAAAAGLANHYSVQYHFGDREELVRAIFRWRLPELDARRAELLLQAQQSERALTIPVLLDCLARPVAEMATAADTRHFVKFLIQVVRSPLWRQLRVDADIWAPAASEIVRNLRLLLPHLSPQTFDFRIIASWLVMLDAIADPMMFVPNGRAEGLTAEHAYSEALSVAVGCFTGMAVGHH